MSRTGPTGPVLARLLEAAGYRLRPCRGGLLALRPSDHRAVVLASSRISPAELDRGFPTDSVRRTIVYDDDPGPVARALASDRGLEILDPWTLGPGLGELLLPEPAGVDGAGPEPELGAGALELPFPLVPPEARIVRPHVGRSEVEALVSIEGARYTLRLVPFYVASYRVRSATAHGDPGPVLHRLVAVNATSRAAEMWEVGERELVEEIGGPYQRFDPQLSEREAVPLALEAIRRAHAVQVDHTEQHAGALVIETRRVAPHPNDVRLGPVALVYVPYWYIEGTAGRIVLDAVSGRRKGEPEGLP